MGRGLGFNLGAWLPQRVAGTSKVEFLGSIGGLDALFQR